MSTPHKASAEQWSDAGAFASDTRAWLLALRARVDALEEVENDRRFEQAKAIIDKPAPAPASSLVERVAKGIGSASPWMHSHRDEARAAIREVAAWLRDRGGYPWAWIAQTLEQEADR